MTSQSIMDRLRAETQAQHKAAESRPLAQAMMAGTLPRELFVASLAQRWLMHRVLESRLRACGATEQRLATVLRDEHFQEANAAADLAYFDVALDEIEPVPATVTFTEQVERLANGSPIHLLGCHYVFEGSKNGARFIARRIASVYGLKPNAGLRYWDPHGEEQRAIWQDYKDAVAGLKLTPDECDGIVAAAKMTFDCVGDADDDVYNAADTAQRCG